MKGTKNRFKELLDKKGTNKMELCQQAKIKLSTFLGLKSSVLKFLNFSCGGVPLSYTSLSYIQESILAESKQLLVKLYASH